MVTDNISTLIDGAYAIDKRAAIEFLCEAYAESLDRYLGGDRLAESGSLTRNSLRLLGN